MQLTAGARRSKWSYQLGIREAEAEYLKAVRELLHVDAPTLVFIHPLEDPANGNSLLRILVEEVNHLRTEE